MFPYLLFFAFLSGELLKFPIFGISGGTFLDIAVFILVVLSLYKLKFKLKRPPLIVKLGVLFICLCLLSLIFTPLNLNIIEKFISFSYSVRLALYVFLGYLIYSTNNLQKNISHLLIYSGVTLAVLGLLQLILFPDLEFLTINNWDPHYFRVVSTFLDPNFIGAFFVLTLLLIIQREYRLKLLLFSIVFIALLATFSRGAFLMFAVSFFSLSILTKSAKIGLLAIILTIILTLTFPLYNKIIAQPRNIDRAESAQFRLNSWQQGLRIFENSPLLGIGFNSYRYGLREYNLTNSQHLNSRGSASNDSSLLHIAATTGLIGLFSFILLLISIFIYSWKDKILVSALVGLLVHSFFANSLFYPFILLWVILRLSIVQRK